MIKTAAIFPDQAALNSAPVLAAMRTAMHRRGIQVRENSLDAEAVIIWSVLWAGRMTGNRAIYQHYQELGRPIVVVDIGTLQRGQTWKIALGNINREGWFGPDDNLDRDRPTKLGLPRTPAPPGDGVLIAGQHRHSLQMQDIPSPEQWVLDQILRIRQLTDRPVVVRPHPRSPLKLDLLPKGVTLQRPRTLPGTYDSVDWSDSWHAVINHNSGPGVLAALAGIRAIVAESSLAWPVAIDPADLERPYQPDRDTWLIGLAHTEYLLHEIEQGLWLERLGSRL